MQQQAGVQLDSGCAPPGAHQGEKSPEKEYTRIKDKAAQMQVRNYRLGSISTYYYALTLIFLSFFCVYWFLLNFIGSLKFDWF